ncbi:MAG: hypothetical protein WBA97_34455 [Actinophytocola sp.]|uniref:hypothetical protein n=1 Tax=Actinophytocola sp. TaxID=1872138 RepID=UPI003C7149EF
MTPENTRRLNEAIEVERLVFACSEAIRSARLASLRENKKLPTERQLARACTAAVLREASGNQLFRELGPAEIAALIAPEPVESTS